MGAWDKHGRCGDGVAANEILIFREAGRQTDRQILGLV